MMTHAELAFRALDKDNSGFITEKELKYLSNKLTNAELHALVKKVTAIKSFWDVNEIPIATKIDSIIINNNYYY